MHVWVSISSLETGIDFMKSDIYADDLKSTAVELQDLVQAKVGTTKFANEYNNIRQGVLTVRRERRATRTLQVLTPRKQIFIDDTRVALTLVFF
jgi:hypothetical protein